MKPIISLFMLFIAYNQIYAQKIETFAYPVGDKLTDRYWTAISGAGSSPIRIDTTSLNIINSVSCKSIDINGSSTDESVKALLGIESGLTDGKINKFQNLYIAFPVSISSAPVSQNITTETNYFFANYSFGTNYRGRVFAQVIDSKLQFGVAFSTTDAGNPISFTTAGYQFNTTYQLVVKMNQNTKVISLYVFEGNTVPTNEPAVASVSHQDINANANGFQYLAFRQVTGLDALVGGMSATVNWPNASNVIPTMLTVKTKPRPSAADWVSYKAVTVDSLQGFQQNLDPQLSQYGGWMVNPSTATGFFRSEYSNGRWWIIDPLGYPYISKGLAVFTGFTSPNQQTKWLTKYQNKANWYTQESTVLRNNGINSLGSFSDVETVRASSQPIPYTVMINPMQEYKKEHIKGYGGSYEQADPWLGGYRYDLVMVFDPEFDFYADSVAQHLVQYKDDPYLLGYFTDNELPWLNDALDRHLTLLAHDEPGYIAAYNWLIARKGAGATVNDIDDSDRQAFTGFYLETYLEKVTTAIKRYDPNHMYLGCRFNQPLNELINPVMFNVAGQYMDVISLNHYLKWEPDSVQMNQWGTWSGKPFIVTEFYVKGNDSGLENTTGAGWVVPTQQDRGYFYENFTLKLLANSNSVGWQWFSYQDNDPSFANAGPTSRDSNKGIIDNDYNHYFPLLGSMDKVNNNAFNLINYFNGNSSSVLPIALASFDANLENGEGNLTWSITSETNNKGFEIQRSNDGGEFRSITFVNSKTNGVGKSSLVNYNYQDKTLLAGANYYRLKQTDTNGNFEYSKVAVVNLSLNHEEILVYPNPVSHTFNVRLNANEVTSQIIYNLYSTNGNVVYSHKSDKPEIEISTANLTSGIYFLKVSNNGKHVGTVKVLKN